MLRTVSPDLNSSHYVVDRCLDFYMGKNTPDRRAFIEKHLITDVV